MSERFATVAVNLLTLVVVCALILLAIMWVPGQLDRLNKRMDRLDAVEASLGRVQTQIDQLAGLSDKLSRAEKATAPLAHMEKTLEAMNATLGTVADPFWKDAKDPVAKQSDIKGLSAEVSKVARQTEPRDNGAAKATQELIQSVAQLRKELAEVRKSLEDLSAVPKDVKSMHLEIQKLEALVKKPSP